MWENIYTLSQKLDHKLKSTMLQQFEVQLLNTYGIRTSTQITAMPLTSKCFFAMFPNHA
jgi:hypothetical protein